MGRRKKADIEAEAAKKAALEQQEEVKETKKPRINTTGDKEKDPEVWEVLGFTDGKYQISNYGNVRSHIHSEEGVLLSQSEVNGYPVVSLMVQGKARQYYVHRLVAENFVKQADGEIIVHHKDWDKKNNYHKNINWITPEWAYKKREKKKRLELKDENKGKSNSKLKPEDILMLKRMLRNGIKQNVIAKLFAISEMQVTRIKRNENWAHIDEILEKEEAAKKNK